jgi:hypothetical protein
VSNSDFKKLRKLIDPKFEDPADLKAIFDFGNLVEDVILEPHKANYNHDDIKKALEMDKTFRADKICQQILYIPDFRRQHEFYRSDRYGVRARCKTDGDSKSMSLVFELKGLSVSSDRAFEEAIDRFDYDQGLAWYLDLTEYKRSLIVAVSKSDTSKLFKRVVDRNHIYYKRGVQKIKKSVILWKQILG